MPVSDLESDMAIANDTVPSTAAPRTKRKRNSTAGSHPNAHYQLQLYHISAIVTTTFKRDLIQALEFGEFDGHPYNGFTSEAQHQVEGGVCGELTASSWMNSLIDRAMPSRPGNRALAVMFMDLNFLINSTL